MHTPSTHHKGTTEQIPPLREDNTAEEQDREDKDPSSGPMPCIAGKFRAASDTLFGMFSEAWCWFVFHVNPNNLQLPSQSGGHSVKGQIWTLGLTEVSKPNVNVFEVGAWFLGNSR